MAMRPLFLEHPLPAGRPLCLPLFHTHTFFGPPANFLELERNPCHPQANRILMLVLK